MILLESATMHGHYDYYHLLTGVDLPLKNQNEILTFFDSQRGKEFISGCEECTFIERIKYYWFFQEKLGIRTVSTISGKIIKKLSIILQKILKIDRTKGKKQQWSIGCAYFDITDKFARYVVENKKEIECYYKNSFCADEIFLQTLYINCRNKNERYVYPITGNEYFNQDQMDILRAIDWKRGFPYIYTLDDYQLLMKSGCLFARKFDEKSSHDLIEMIKNAICDI